MSINFEVLLHRAISKVAEDKGLRLDTIKNMILSNPRRDQRIYEAFYGVALDLLNQAGQKTKRAAAEEIAQQRKEGRIDSDRALKAIVAAILENDPIIR